MGFSRKLGCELVPQKLYRIGAAFLFLLLGVTLPAPSAWAQEGASANDLASKSLEDLMNMKVTSVSKKEQKLSQVASALFVITQEDIRRSGALNIPDLLRMVPGLDVAQIDANTWAISARGFNLQFTSKLLVLIDGRAVYTPLFGGVYWDTQDVPLEDIDRIEVIRGPGGTVWGANAVNGVINIITKKASETQGALLTGGGGNTAQGFGTVQYGGQIRQDTSYRVFAKYLDDGHFPDPGGQNAHDGWNLLHGGFRADSALSAKDSLTIQGDLYSGSEGATIAHSFFNPPFNVNLAESAALSGGNMLGRWSHVFSDRIDTTLQLYVDKYSRDGPESDEDRWTADLDFQNHLALGSRQDLIWGLGYRFTSDQTLGTIDQAFLPASQSLHLFNSFVQDQITLLPGRLSLYLGTKLENSYFTGFDIQPSVRLAWTPGSRSTVWAAISRAARTPGRRDEGLSAVLAALPGPTEVVLLGNPLMQSEHVIAYESGYRAAPSESVSLDLAAFFNTYSNLETQEPQPSFLDSSSQPPVLVNPIVFGNKMYGTTEGIEAALNWKATRRWTLSPSYSFLEMHLHTRAGSTDSTSVTDTQGTNPGHQAQFRSHVELWPGLAWDANAYFVGRLPAAQVAAYTRPDSQLTWRLAERASFSVVGQNLLQDHHLEFSDQSQSVNSSEVKRSAYARFTWQF